MGKLKKPSKVGIKMGPKEESTNGLRESDIKKATSHVRIKKAYIKVLLRRHLVKCTESI